MIRGFQEVKKNLKSTKKPYTSQQEVVNTVQAMIFIRQKKL